jgi:uncharacterized protein YoxC
MSENINAIIETLVAAISQKLQESAGTTTNAVTPVDIIGGASRLEYLDKEIDKLKVQQQFIQSIYNDSKSLAELEIGNQIKKVEKNKQIAKLFEDINEAKRTGKDLTNDQINDLKEYSEELDEILEKEKDLQRAKGAGNKLGNLLGFDENKKSDLVYQMFKNPKQVFGQVGESIDKFGGGVKGTFTMIGIILGQEVVKQTIEAFKQYDQAAASLAKVAGANEQLQSVLSNTARGATAYGISFAQAGKAIEGLYTELNTFSNLSQAAQEQLVISTAKLEKLGISSQQSAKQIATLTQIMGMTETQAAKTSEELAGFALAIGRSPTQVASDFAAASERLGAYGNKMVDVFKNLETQAKGTGVALSDLLRIAEKFQTFEGAATAAAKLNAALGGGFVNAMELLEASAEDPSKAIDLLRTRLNDAGLAFNQMSFYEQKLIADAGGFKSVEEASRILSMTNAEAERAAAADAERANQQQLLNDAIQRSIPIQEKIQLLMANLAIVMGPVVDAVSGLISMFTMLVDNPIGGFLLKIGLAIGLIFTPVGWLGAAVYALGLAFEYLHDIILKPHSPILFGVLKDLPGVFSGMTSSLNGLDGQMNRTLGNMNKFEGSVKGIASSFEALPDSISVTTPQLDKLNTSMEVTSKITDATKQSVDSINNLNTEKANQLVNIMSPQQPNVTVSPTINQPAPEVKVYLGNEPIKGIVNKVMNGGSNLSPQALGVPLK